MQRWLSQLKLDFSRNFRLFAALALALFGAVVSSAAAQFTASLSQNTAVVGEAITLTLNFEGGAPQQISSLPAIDGLQVNPGVSSGVNTTMGPDGAMKTVQSYSLTFVPTRPGEFVIPAFQAKVDGQTLTSQPLKLKVTLDDANAPPVQFAATPVFLWLVAPPSRDLFVGEVLTLEIRLYVRSDVRRVASPNIPLAADGFIFGKPVQGQQLQRRLGNTPFTVVPIFVAMTPMKTGALTVPAVNGSVVINPRDMFDFFGPPPQQIGLSLAEQKFNVLPLPTDNVPPAFNGAVGNFTMTFSAGPTNVAVGDPITAKVQITGQGQLETLSLPDQPAWHDFKTYPPTMKLETTDPLGVQGTKSFEQILLPQNADIKEIPAVSFSFFDPSQKAYRTLTQPAIPLTVRSAGATVVPAIAAAAHGAADSAPPAQDIVPIKQRPGVLAQITPPLVRQPWFLVLQSVPLLAFLSALTWRKRNESLANNPRLRRQRQVAQVVRDGLNDLKKAAAENNSDRFFATLFRLLQEQLGERLDLPASSITEAVIEEHLRPRGVSEDTLNGLHELFQTCNLARYAPIQSSQELAAIIPNAAAVLRELQGLKL
jgi:hypothetical protein